MKTTQRFSDTITKEQYHKLTSSTIPYERNPDHPDKIRSSMNFNEIHESVREIVAKLPVVEFKSSFFDGILDGDQQFYLMTYREKVFLIDTQGFNYARYVVQLKDLVVMEKEKPVETMLMKAHPGSVETIIDILKHMDVDGETMEFILQKVGMEEQMLRQLFLKADTESLVGLFMEWKNV